LIESFIKDDGLDN